MFKNVLKWNFLLILAIAAFGTACEKDIAEEATPDSTNLLLEERSDPYEGTRGSGGMLARGCFEFVFPVTVSFPDGGSEEVNTPQELRQAFRIWCVTNEGTDRPSVVMPFEVVVEEDMTILIESGEDFRSVVADCLPDGAPYPRPHRLCFRPVFPLTIIFPNGNSQEVQNRFQLKIAIRVWKQNNPGATERPTIEFPYDVTLQDGTIITLNNQDELQALLEECAPDGPDGPCFQPVYPLTLINPDGTTVEIESRIDLRIAIRSWFVNNPDSNERPVLEYPFEVTLQDGNTISVDNAEALQELWAECGYSGPDRPCFRPVFPLTIAYPDGSSTEVNNRFEFRLTIREWVINNPDADERPTIAFPYDVMLADGSLTTIENAIQLQQLLSSCQD